MVSVDCVSGRYPWCVRRVASPPCQHSAVWVPTTASSCPRLPSKTWAYRQFQGWGRVAQIVRVDEVPVNRREQTPPTHTYVHTVGAIAKLERENEKLRTAPAAALDW